MPNYTYTTGIPAGNLTPGQQRSDLQTNNDSAASIWEVDHFGFGVNDGGYHDKVTFPYGTTPTPTASGPLGVLYAFLDASSASQLKFVNKTTTVQLTGITLTNSGSNYGLTTPWGLIINFGSADATTGGVGVTYAVRFNNFRAISLGVNNASASITATVSASSSEGCTIKSTAHNTVWYIALGN